jgi:HK97 family phage major capsid protein
MDALSHLRDEYVIKAADDDAGDDAGEVVAAVEAFSEKVDKKLGTLTDEVKAARAEAKAAKDRADELETKLNRPGRSGSGSEPTEEVKAFGVYLRHGDKGAGAEIVKTLRVSVDPQGGYLAPPEFNLEFVRDLTLLSPVRSVASVRTTGSASVIYPKRTGITNAAWRGEAAAQTSTDPTFGQVEVPVREVNTYVDISNQLLADSGGSAEAEVRQALAEDFAAKEGAAFVSGDGIVAPEGFLTNTDVAYTATGVSGGFAASNPADNLITLFYALPAQYRNMGTWGMNGTVLAAVRKFKDSQGQYLWQPALVAGQPETILGRPVVEMPDMPDIAANSYSVVFGDFATAYRIVDRVDLSILVNPYIQATNGITRFHATRRVGGGVIQPKAIRRLKFGTS